MSVRILRNSPVLFFVELGGKFKEGWKEMLETVFNEFSMSHIFFRTVYDGMFRQNLTDNRIKYIFISILRNQMITLLFFKAINNYKMCKRTVYLQIISSFKSIFNHIHR